ALWDGAAWSAFGPGLDGPVSALVDWNGTLVAGGDFLTSGGMPVSHVARWDPTTGTWQRLGGGSGSGGGPDGPARAVAVWDGARVGGGHFGNAGGTSANGVAVWNGALWSALGSGVRDQSGAPGEVDAVAIETTGTAGATRLHVGGAFALAGTASANDVATWDG